jgi:hypothetical protein
MNGVKESFKCLFIVVFLVDLVAASNASIPCLACLIVSVLTNTSLQSIATRCCLLAGEWDRGVAIATDIVS